ncbi:MAG: UDP-N-acetylmuramoyl-L-alanine--D-glutamate ligase [Candidatus Paceibacterota bacterium]
MKNYKEQFKGKKITIMGLGILGRGLGYTKFLAECGADLIVTDLKNKEQLATSLKALSKFSNIKFVLNEHRLEDFRDRDMIIKAAGVPLNSIYIEEAKKNNIPIEMDVSLFIKSAPDITVVGITGTRGKSMTTMLINEILSKNIKDKKVYLGGNIRGVATLPFLKKAKAGDILVCELDSWQLQGFGENRVSPNISIFTSFMPDHMNYYSGSMKNYFNDKANIFKYQKSSDVLIIRPEMKKFISKKDTKGKLIIVNKKEVENWKFIVPGEHQRENLACAIAVANQFGISENKIKKTVADFKGMEGRLQLLRLYNGIKIYNDNNATTPEAVIAGIKALSFPETFPETGFRGVSPKPGLGEKRIVLICGGADKKLDLTNFVKVVNKNCKAVSLIPGTGTDILLSKKLKVESYKGKDFKDVIFKALKFAKKGDIILFSPAFASFGMFNNEYERNDLFVKLIKKLK